MKHFLLLNSVLFYCSMLFSQINHQRIVADVVTRKGIPYATIKVVNKPDGTYADSTGMFNVKTDESDSLLVTCVGFQTETKIAVLDTIYLKPAVVDLASVEVRAIKSKESIVGLVDSKRNGTFYFCGNTNSEFSVLIKIPDSFTYYRIKGVQLKSKHENGTSLIRLHIYSQRNDGSPDKEILPQDVIINSNLKSNGKIDLSRFNLIRNDRVLFVGIEDIKASTRKTAKSFDECIGIGMTSEENVELTYHRTLKDPNYQWKRSHFGQKRKGNPGNLMVSLIID